MSVRHGGLSQWGRSNRPRIGPGTVKSLNAPWELSSQPSDRTMSRKLIVCQSGQGDVLYRIWNRATIGSGQYTLLSGRPVHTGQVLFEFKFTTAQSEGTVNIFSSDLYRKMAISDSQRYLKSVVLIKHELNINICNFKK